MKKIITALVIIMISALFAVSVSAKTYLKGDINMDGNIRASDARLALRAGAKLEKISEIQKLICDINDDGKISAADARIILRISAKIEENKGEIDIDDSDIRTELLSGIGMNIDDFMKKYGSMKKLETVNGTVSYANDFITVMSNPKMIQSGKISSIKVTGGNYMLCGVYAGMSADKALSTLKDDKWIVQQETASQIVLAKIGMSIKIAVSKDKVTIVEYYMRTSVVNPGTSENTTKPSGSTAKPPESSTKPSAPTTKPSADNVVYNKLPKQAKAYISGEFGIKGYNYNKGQKVPVSMFISKNNIKAGMTMDMDDGTTMNIDVIMRDPSGNPKMYIACHETKKYCEIDSSAMSLLQINPDDLKISSTSIDINKVKITEKSVKEGNTTYTVYNIKSDAESCELYMIGDNIKRIYTYDNVGNLKTWIDVDVFYPQVSESEFSFNNLKKGTLPEVFGFSSNPSDIIS